MQNPRGAQYGQVEAPPQKTGTKAYMTEALTNYPQLPGPQKYVKQ